MSLARSLAAIGLAVLVVTSCTSTGPLSPDAARLTETELRMRLNEYVQGFVDEVERAADAISQATDDRELRRRALLWKIHAVEAAHEALLVEPPMTAFVDLWTFAVQMRAFFDGGAGQDVFAPSHQEAVTAARRIEERIESLAQDLLPSSGASAAQQAVLAFAQHQPMLSIRGRRTNRPSGAPPTALSQLQSVLAIPLTPFRVFQGVDEGAQAIRRLAAVSDRFTNIVEELPERASWQVELLLYDLEERETLRRSLDSLEQLSDSSARVATSVEGLPEELRTTLIATVDEIGEHQAALQETLRQAQLVSADVTEAVGRAELAAGAFDRAALSVAEAGRAWEAAAHALGLAGAPDAGAEPSGFDLAQLDTTAQSVTAAAVELQATVARFEDLLDGDAVERLDVLSRESIDHSAEQIERLVDHAAWRAVQVVLVAFAALLVYRFVARRLSGPRSSA